MDRLTSLLNLDPPRQVFHLPAGDVWIQRDDLIHPVISGNKWRKLQGHLRRMQVLQKQILVTFGGAYSNHLVATAVAAQLSGIQAVGILRGDEPLQNPYLDVAREAGMNVVGVSRSVYRDKNEALKVVLGMLGIQQEAVYVVAEGGKGEEGFEGFEALVEAWMRDGKTWEHVFHASATATTALGLRKALNAAGVDTEIHAVMVLKNEAEQREFAESVGVFAGIDFLSGYEFGGYAKADAVLMEFMEALTLRNMVPIDRVYTAKALFALNDWLLKQQACGRIQRDEEGIFPVIFLHTGGVLRRWDE